MTRVDAARTIAVSSLAGLSHAEASAAARAELGELLSVLRTLSDDDWARPTDCELWSVKDIVAHLVGWAEHFLSVAESAHQLRAGFARRGEFGGDLIAAINQVQVDDRADLAPAELLAHLEDVYPRFLRRRDALALAGIVVPFYMPLFGLTHARYMLGVIYTRDLLMHRLDVALATGRPRPIGPATVRVIEDVLRDWTRRRAVDATVVLGAPLQATYVCGSGHRARIAAAPAELCRVLTGRAAPDTLAVEGDRQAAGAWLSQGCPF